jgi:type IV pilus assembly protein PilV
MKTPSTPTRERGFLMIEVLITMFILLVGLLGIVGLQARSQQAETESYQRTQALMLLRDMADRMNANRANVASYVTGTSTPLGTGSPIGPCAAPSNAVETDQCAWRAALLGAAETSSGACNAATGVNCVGAMIGARGCITALDVPNRIYLIEVVWQGLSSTAAPPASVICGKTAGFGGDEFRRAVTTIVQIGDLGT